MLAGIGVMGVLADGSGRETYEVAPDDGRSALHQASLHGFLTVARALLRIPGVADPTLQ